MTKQELKNISKIPKGYYCYKIKNDKQITCSYWSLNAQKPENLNGYCAFLSKGDWELSPEYNKELKIIDSKKKTDVGKTVKEVLGEDWPTSLLFDQVKECGENL